MITKANEAYTMTMRTGKAIIDYRTRFQATAHEGDIQDSQGLALRFLASLLPHIRENVQVAWHSCKGKKLPKSVAAVLEIAQAVSVQKRLHTHMQQEESARAVRHRTLENNQARASSSSTGMQNHRPVGCAYHGPHAHHSTNECKKAGKQTHNNCHFCTRPWTPQHHCQEYVDDEGDETRVTLRELCAYILMD